MGQAQDNVSSASIFSQKIPSSSSNIVYSNQNANMNAGAEATQNKQSIQDLIKIYNQPRNEQLNKLLASITSSQPKDFSQQANELAFADIKAVKTALLHHQKQKQIKLPSLEN